jgi:hypothetical protein
VSWFRRQQQEVSSSRYIHSDCSDFHECFSSPPRSGPPSFLSCVYLVPFPWVEVGAVKITFNPTIYLHRILNFNAPNCKQFYVPSFFITLLPVWHKHKFRIIYHIVLYFPVCVSKNWINNSLPLTIYQRTSSNYQPVPSPSITNF